MGIRQEIERRKFAERTLLDEYARQERETIRKLEAIEDRNWTIARSLASRHVQKLKESGATEVLNELSREEHLRVWSVIYDSKRVRYRALSSYETKPAEAEIYFDAYFLVGSTITRVYHMIGFDLKPVREPVEFPQDSEETNPVRNSKIEGGRCFAKLLWNQNSLYGSYDELKFSLYRGENDFYELELTGAPTIGISKPLLFPECSWSRKQLEQAVVEAYLNPLFRHHSPPPDDLDNNS